MGRIKMMEHKNNIDCLANQIDAILDLIKSGAENADPNSIACASDMCQTLLLELEKETDEVVDEWKEAERQADNYFSTDAKQNLEVKDLN